jgi:hypothetical protein
MPNGDPMASETSVPPSELPSPRALRRATVVAALVGAVLLVTAVLPAEYNIDPTGLGRVLGLKEIGEIKQDGREEAAAAAADSARALQRRN